MSPVLKCIECKSFIRDQRYYLEETIYKNKKVNFHYILTICCNDVDKTAMQAQIKPFTFTFTSVTVQTPTPTTTTATAIFTSLE